MGLEPRDMYLATPCELTCDPETFTRHERNPPGGLKMNLPRGTKKELMYP